MYESIGKLIFFAGVGLHIEPSWERLGAVLGPLGAVLGSLGAVLEPSWAILRKMSGTDERRWLQEAKMYENYRRT